MEQVQRVYFPGFKFLHNNDTGTHEVEVGTIAVDGVEYTIEFLKSKRLEGRGDFLPASMRKKGQRIWSFKDEGIAGIAKLIEASPGVPVICVIVGSGKGQRVARVIPLSSLSRRHPIMIRGNTHFVDPDEDIGETVRLKQLTAKQLGIGISFSDIENQVAQYQQQKIVKKRKEEEAEREAERVREAHARRERINGIMFRKKITGFTAEGRPFRGIPVTRDEYQCLPKGTYVILVDSYDQITNSHGNLIEGFRLGKTPGGRIEKVNLTPVSKINPITNTTSEAVPEAAYFILIEHEKRVKRVLVFTSQENIRIARERGLNGGTLVTTETAKQEDGRYEVYSVTSTGRDTLGLFKSLSQQ